METRKYVDIIRAQWRLIAACAAVAVVVAFALWFVLPRQYTAYSTFYVSAQVGGENAAAAYQGSLLSEQRVSSYATLITSPRVMTAVAAAVGSPTDPDSVEDLSKKVTATSETNSVLIQVEASDRSPGDAARLGQAITRVFPPLVAELERPATPQGTPAVAVRSVSEPQVPTEPSSLGLNASLALGLLVGLIIGLVSAVLRARLDTSIKTTGRLAEVARVGTLSEVVTDPEVAEEPLAARGKSKIRAEAYNRLRTNLRFIDVDHPPRVIGLTSAVSGEGKSSTSANLAVSLAAEGNHVLLVDGDLRKPSVHSFFGLEPVVGLTTVLTGRVTLTDAVQATGMGSLDVLASGQIPPNPSELLSSSSMKTVVEEMARSYNYVLVDTPPLLAVTDAAVVARNCDGILLVVKYGSTRIDQVISAREALDVVNAHVIGSVLSMLPTSGRSGYGYGYGYPSRGAFPEQGTGSEQRARSVGDATTETMAAPNDTSSTRSSSSARPSPHRRGVR